MSLYITFLVVGVLFLCGRFRRKNHIRSNRDNKSNYDHLYITESHRYSNHYRIINFVGFEAIYHAITLHVISLSMIFNELVYVFL